LVGRHGYFCAGAGTKNARAQSEHKRTRRLSEKAKCGISAKIGLRHNFTSIQNSEIRMNIKTLFKILRNLKIKSFQKGETIINEGDAEKDVFYIRKGLIRCYFIDEKGEEITYQLFAEHQVFGNAHAILFDEPSRFFYETLEKTKVYSTDLKSFQGLTTSHPDLIDMDRMGIGGRILKNAFRRLESFVFLTPEERYQKYIKDYPNIIDRVPDKYIANVLGITPVSLSRIRSRIASKKKK